MNITIIGIQNIYHLSKYNRQWGIKFISVPRKALLLLTITLVLSNFIHKKFFFKPLHKSKSDDSDGYWMIPPLPIHRFGRWVCVVSLFIQSETSLFRHVARETFSNRSSKLNCKKWNNVWRWPENLNGSTNFLEFSPLSGWLMKCLFLSIYSLRRLHCNHNGSSNYQ